MYIFNSASANKLIYLFILGVVQKLALVTNTEINTALSEYLKQIGKQFFRTHYYYRYSL